MSYQSHFLFYFITLRELFEYYLFSLFNTLNAELNPICHLLALLGAHHVLHVSRIRFNDVVSNTDLHSAKKAADCE